MLDKKFFKNLRKNYAAYDDARREIIKRSQDIVSRSKQAIFALHRGDEAGGERLIREVDAMIRASQPTLRRVKDVELEGSYRAALEEYVEARLFGDFLRGKKIGAVVQRGIDEDVYLGGVMDFTGEVVRFAVNAASRRDLKAVKRAHGAIVAVMGELVLMNITGPLRPKFDQAKTNLRKMEEIVYDLSLRS